MKTTHLFLILATFFKVSESDFVGHREYAHEILARANGLEVLSSDRTLRGGKSSSGGRSGSYSGNRNRTNSGSSSWSSMSRGAKIFAGVAALGIGLLALGFLFPAAFAGMGLAPLLAACCCGMGLAGAANASKQSSGNGSKMNSSQVEMNSFEFENKANQARAEVESSSEGMYAPMNSPLQGRYTTSFRDPGSGTIHKATLDLYFEQRGSYPYGYRISGKGSDIDGETVIEEGHANFDGTAWWKERTITGDVGLLVLSTGKFDFERGTFVGTWLANSMITGPYISFAFSDGAQSTTNSYTHAIPVATATVISPISPEYKN